jgi:transmembrane sensor
MNTQIYEEACTWFVESRAGDMDDASRREFDRWLRKSPEHLSAYLEIAAIWNEGPLLDPHGKWSADTLIRQAYETGDDNVVALVPAAGAGNTVTAEQGSRMTTLKSSRDALSSRVDAPRNGWFRRWRRLASAASVAVLAILGGTLMMLELSAPIYTTALGEQRSMQFEDGSTVELNSRSKIRVKYSKQERDVELLEGQALFHVAHDAGRPFIVAVGSTRVRAVGTQFDVYKKSSATVVTVVEGRVAVYSTPHGVLSGASGNAGPPLPVQGPPPSSGATAVPQRSSPTSPVLNSSAATATDSALQSTGETTQNPLPSNSSFLVSAGEQLTITPEAAQKAANPNIASVTAWREREIVFESASLSDVAEEFNRYNERRLVIEDPQSLNFHVSGVFSSTDPEALIRFFKQRPGIKVTETETEIRIERNISHEGVTNR